MAKKYAVLQKIRNDRRITGETDAAFLHQLQLALLLALREQGSISSIQYSQAEEKLNRQCRKAPASTHGV